MPIDRHQATGLYRPWQPPSFDEAENRREQPPAGAEAARQGVQLPTVEELEALYEQSRREGFAAGHEEGFAAGRAEGLARGVIAVQRVQEALGHVVGHRDRPALADALDQQVRQRRHRARSTNHRPAAIIGSERIWPMVRP